MTTSLVARIEAATARPTGVTFLGGPERERVLWSELHDDARAVAAALQARGVGEGSRVGLLGETSRPLLTALEATWLAGAAAIVLPLPTRLASPEQCRVQTRDRLALADVVLTVADTELQPIAGGGPGDAPVVELATLWAEAQRTGPSSYERPADDPGATAVIQFTSGSTSDPKGVVIPHRCILDNLAAAAERAPMDADDDVVVSWLPLYHDMGLVYNAINAMVNGAEFAIAPPTAFVSSPGRWMSWMSELRGTWSVGPNFGIAVARRLLGRGGRLDLSRVRRLGSGSEPVDVTLMEAFAAEAAGSGFDPGALYAGYGMAEATVAISIPPMNSGFTVDVVDDDSLTRDRRADPVAPDRPGARRLARCGPPIRGMELRIVDPETGAALGERGVGEIEVRGPSVVPGYFRNEQATRAALREDGWLRTGDQGYLAEGDVMICGRIKDMIVIGGRNVFPEDLERAVQAVPGVRPGNVIAFGVDAGRKGESVVVAAEIKAGTGDHRPDLIRAEIARAVRSAAGLRLEDVVLLAPGSLPKTSSGKLQRSACRARYRKDELERL